ncbi:tetratricopeptide repeat protein [Desulfotomaculum copahuensis]|uniref:Tetratricopeptide repeat protein n=1 Tax=Desulfotomaculum copahuensis TaxID=1838280 RepID=A0A1B7LBJ3_9FIRM|nr:tetratricopeptide repeat protein [Desulfotomaculum copahuensis]OAT79907.1 hypothetical protein A6M21_14440 [Desulfotomaculum copahuensis]
MSKKSRRKPVAIPASAEPPVKQVLKQSNQVKAAKPAGRRQDKHRPARPAVLAAATVLCAAVFLTGGSLAAAGNYAQQAGAQLQAGNAQQGLADLQKAVTYNPFNADYHGELARVYLATGQPRQALAEALQTAARSERLADARALLAQAYLANGKYEEAVAHARRAVELAPYQINWYETLAAVYAGAGRGELQAGQKDAARRHLTEALQVPAMIQARVNGLGAEEKRLWKDAPMLAVTPHLQLYLGEAEYMLGQQPQAEKDLQAASGDNQAKGEALTWLAVLKHKQGKEAEAQKLLQQADAVNKGYTNMYSQLVKTPVL